MESKNAAGYDFNGPMLDVEPFWDFLKGNHPSLYDAYRIQGATNIELKKKHKGEVMAIYEDALENGRYPAVLMPFVGDRLELDMKRGITPVVFTTAPTSIVLDQARNTGIDHLIGKDQVITLSEVLRYGHLPDNTPKEDKSVFVSLARFLTTKGYGRMETYVDDGEQRIIAALEANQQLASENRIGRLFLYDTKGARMTSQPASRMDSTGRYMTVSNLMDIS